eukprot:maker-scaffold440_size170678-snap-gene-0.28 protein:Tk09653 transcript:maker-scaffold440_size170678-snap-gene-0.28-mRNA-1 annotation:"zinc finger protein"
MDDDDLIIQEEEELDDEMDEDMADPLTMVKVGMVDAFPDDSDEEEDEDESLPSEEGSESGQHQCSQCHAFFSTHKNLKKHFKTAHQSQCYWTCKDCGAVFNDVEIFKLHLVKLHKMNKESFTLDDPGQNPVLNPKFTMEENIQVCPECNMQFGNKASLNIHRLKRHISKNVTKNVPCPVCQVEAADLTAHVRKEHNIDGVVCPQCGKILSKTCTLNRHLEQVHLNLQIHKPAKCGQCGKIFSKKGHLDRHIRTIHMGIKETSEPCPYCGKIFSTKSSLEPHIEMVHKGVRRACSECGKVLSDLWKHMRTVHGFYRRRAKIPKESLDMQSVTDILTSPAPDMKPKTPNSSPPPMISPGGSLEMPSHIQELVAKAMAIKAEPAYGDPDFDAIKTESAYDDPDYDGIEDKPSFGDPDFDATNLEEGMLTPSVKITKIRSCKPTMG